MERASKERVKVFPSLNGGSKDWRGGGGQHKHAQTPIHLLAVWSGQNSGRRVTAAEGRGGWREGGRTVTQEFHWGARDLWARHLVHLSSGGPPPYSTLLFFLSLPEVKTSRMWRRGETTFCSLNYVGKLKSESDVQKTPTNKQTNKGIIALSAAMLRNRIHFGSAPCAKLAVTAWQLCGKTRKLLSQLLNRPPPPFMTSRLKCFHLNQGSVCCQPAKGEAKNKKNNNLEPKPQSRQLSP